MTWRNDWTVAGAGPMGGGGGYILSGENAGDQAGQAGRSAGANAAAANGMDPSTAPGAVGYGPGFWYWDAGPGVSRSTGNDPGSGAANPSARDSGGSQFGQGGSTIKLPRGAQADIDY